MQTIDWGKKRQQYQMQQSLAKARLQALKQKKQQAQEAQEELKSLSSQQFQQQITPSQEGGVDTDFLQKQTQLQDNILDYKLLNSFVTGEEMDEQEVETLVNQVETGQKDLSPNEQDVLLANRQKLLNKQRAQEVAEKGKKGLREYITKDYDVMQPVPFVPTEEERGLITKAIPVILKQVAGKDLSFEEKKWGQDYQNKIATDNEREKTFAADVYEVLTTMPGHMGAFLTTYGLAGKATKKATMQAIRKALPRVARSAAGKIGTQTAGMLTAGGAMAAVDVPGTLSQVAQGTALGKSPAKSVYDAMVNQSAEYAGEQAGLFLSRYGGRLIKRLAPKGSWLSKMSETAVNKRLRKGLEKVGYHGTLEEMGEERFSDVLRAGLGVQGWKQVIPSPRQLAVEATAFSVPGGARAGASAAINYRNKQKALQKRNEYLQTPTGIAAMADNFPEDMQRIADTDQPSRKDFKQAGLEGFNAQERKNIATDLKTYLEERQKVEQRLKSDEAEQESQQQQQVKQKQNQQIQQDIQAKQPKMPRREKFVADTYRSPQEKKNALQEYAQALIDISETPTGIKNINQIADELDSVDKELSEVDKVLPTIVGIEDPKYIDKKLSKAGFDVSNYDSREGKIYAAFGYGDWFDKGKSAEQSQVDSLLKQARQSQDEYAENAFNAGLAENANVTSQKPAQTEQKPQKQPKLHAESPEIAPKDAQKPPRYPESSDATQKVAENQKATPNVASDMQDKAKIGDEEAQAAKKEAKTNVEQQQATVKQPSSKQPWEMTKSEFFHPQYNRKAIDRLQTANQGDIAGTVGDFIKGEKTRKLLEDVLDIPVIRLDKPVQNGKQVDAAEGYDYKGASGRLRGKPAIFIKNTDDFLTTLLEEASHQMRVAKGRQVTKQDITTAENIEAAQGLPEEISAKKFTQYLKSLATEELDHKNVVQRAVKDNKPVPRNVLEEYKGESWADEALTETGDEVKKEEKSIVAEAKKALKSGRGDKLRNSLLKSALESYDKGEAGIQEVQKRLERWRKAADYTSKVVGERDAAISNQVDSLKKTYLDKYKSIDSLTKALKAKNKEIDKFRKTPMPTFDGQYDGMENLQAEKKALQNAIKEIQSAKKGDKAAATDTDAAPQAPQEQDVSGEKQQVSPTSTPKAWYGEPLKQDNQGRLTHAKGASLDDGKGGKGTRKSFIWSGEYEEVPTRLPKKTMDALKERSAGDVHRVTNQGQGEDYWLIPKSVYNKAREDLGEAAFKRIPKPKRSPKQRFNDEFLSLKALARKGTISEENIGQALADMLITYERTPDSLSAEQRNYYDEFKESEAYDAQQRDNQEDTKRDSESVGQDLSAEERAEREAIQAVERGEVETEAISFFDDIVNETEAEAKPKPDMETLIDAAAKWKGASLKADELYGEDKKARLKHSNITTKADLDDYLMRAFGVNDLEARQVSNSIFEPDMSANVSDYVGEKWADNAISYAEADKKPNISTKKSQDKDLFGTRIIKPQQGQQLELGLDKTPVAQREVPVKKELVKAVGDLRYKSKEKDPKAITAELAGQKELFNNPADALTEVKTALLRVEKGKSLFDDQPKAGAKGGRKKTTSGAAPGASTASYMSGVDTPRGYGKVEASETKERTVKQQPKQTDKEQVNKELPGLGVLGSLKIGLAPAKQAYKDIAAVISPAHTSKRSEHAASLIRQRLAEAAQKDAVTNKKMVKVHNAFTWMNKSDILDFLDRMEKGEKQPTAKLQQFADVMRELLDQRREEIRGLGKGLLQTYFENYFPHMWKRPEIAEEVIQRFFGKKSFEGSKSFLKKRSIMTIKEGVEMGLEPVFWNPADILVAQLHEMDKFIASQRMIADLKKNNYLVFKPAQTPLFNGYDYINDNAFTVNMPPKMDVPEAYDLYLVDQMLNLADQLGIDTKRYTKIGGKKLGFAKLGEDKVTTRGASPETVLMHEIGHIIGYRYNVFNTIREVNNGEYKTITKGKNKGQTRFVPNKEAVQRRKKIDEQWRILADMRAERLKKTKSFQQYIRNFREKEAVIFEAYLNIPKKFKQVAPDLYNAYDKFIKSRPELSEVINIERSLTVGESNMEVPVPGRTELGRFVAPQEVARLLNNYLSPGIRRSPNHTFRKLYRTARGIGNAINQMNLAMSAFHGFNVTTDLLASATGEAMRKLDIKGQRKLGAKELPLVLKEVAGIIGEGTKLRKAWSTGLNAIEDPRLRKEIELIIIAGGRGELDSVYFNQQFKALRRSFEDIIRGSALEKMFAGIKLPINTLGAAVEAMAYPLMQWYVPALKLGLMSKMAQSQARRLEDGEISEQEFRIQMAKDWDSVENRLGQLTYDNLFWNQILKDTAMLNVRSVGWTGGGLREYGGGLWDLFTTPSRLGRGDTLISRRSLYVFSALFVHYPWIGATIQYVLTGEPPKDLKDLYFPRTGNTNPDGTPERLALPTYAKDMYGYSIRPWTTLKHKAHPLISLMADLAQNEDFWGTVIRDPRDPYKEQAEDVAKHIGESFLPFTVKNWLKLQESDPETPVKNAVITFSGMMSAPNYISRSPAERLMFQYGATKGSGIQFSQSESERKQYRGQFLNDIKRGKSVNIKEAIQTIGRPAVKRAFRIAAQDPFIYSFKRLTLYEAMNVYRICNKEERKKVKNILIKKRWNKTKPLTDDEIQYYNALMTMDTDNQD